jgi:DMSO/TMAO reductase YedYZ molybdopterin-dependent catalytic subunit
MVRDETAGRDRSTRRARRYARPIATRTRSTTSGRTKPAVSKDPTRPELPRWRAALAGALAAAIALAVTELVSAVASPSRPSVVTSVADRFVDLAAGSLRGVAVSEFGTNDKAALLVGIVIISLGIGALTGEAAAKRRWVGRVVFAVFAGIGIFSGWTDSQASAPVTALASILGALAGIAALEVLLRLAWVSTMAPVSPRGVEDPRVRAADRRTFLLAAGSVGAFAAVGAVASKGLRGPSTAAKSRATVALPSPVQTTPLPAQPFSVPGLSPYITSSDDFYRIDTAIFVPQVDASTWKLTIKGMVDNTLTWTYDEMLGMDMVEVPVTLSCVSNEVGGDLVGNAVWRGVPLKTLLDRAGVKPGATQIVGRSVDDFTVGFPTEKALDGRTALVAFGMNGAPLPVVHGFPARLVVAGLYGYVSATKWLKSIELGRLEDYDAYWVPRGWAKEGPIKLSSRVDVPRSGAQVPGGQVTIAGVAWEPDNGISKVEVQLDGGPWLPAELGDAASKDTWVQWRLVWRSTPGTHTAAVRAYDAAGKVQTSQMADPAPDGASGYHYRSFVVAG